MSDERRVDLAKLTAVFPKKAIKSRRGAGNRNFDYLETATVIYRLNEATGNQWDYRITRLEWSGDLLIATGELTIPGLGTRSGTGVQRVAPGGGEDLVKGASSDCLKNCAKLFGVGLELYGDDYESHEDQRADAGASDEPANGPRSEAPPTARQVKFLHALARERGLTDDDLNAECERLFGAKTSDLSRRDVSILIERYSNQHESSEQPPDMRAPTPIQAANDDDQPLSQPDVRLLYEHCQKRGVRVTDFNAWSEAVLGKVAAAYTKADGRTAWAWIKEQGERAKSNGEPA